MASMVLISSCGVDSRPVLCTLNWCCLTCDIYSVGNYYPQVLFLNLNCEVMLYCWLSQGVFVFAWIIAIQYMRTLAFAGVDAGDEVDVEVNF